MLLQAIAPYVPIISPQLSKLCYGMTLAYYLAHDSEVMFLLLLLFYINQLIVSSIRAQSLRALSVV
jgi:hypothetical protein